MLEDMHLQDDSWKQHKLQTTGVVVEVVVREAALITNHIQAGVVTEGALSPHKRNMYLPPMHLKERVQLMQAITPQFNTFVKGSRCCL